MTEEARSFPSPAFQKAIKETGHVSPMAGGTPRNKRIRPWELCDDVQELKRMLTEKDDLLEEQNDRNAKLHKELESARASVRTTSSTTLTPAKLQKEVESLVRSIPRKVKAVMTYKTKHASSKLIPVEIAGIEESVMRGVFGETLSSLGAQGAKQIKVVASNEDLEAVFQGGCFSKGLRFGATLELQKGLTFVYTKETKSLQITGTYSMCK